MTGPDNSAGGTRPISVAELLAKNGTIGAPPVGGRRRRRRGNNDSVTVAELTGEIPIVRTGEIPVVADEAEDDDESATAEDVQDIEAPSAAPAVEQTENVEPADDRPTAPPATNGKRNGNGLAPATSNGGPRVAEPEAPRPAPERAPDPAARRGRASTPERSHYPRPARKGEGPAGRPRPERGAGAELMRPDPIDVEDSDDVELDLDLEADEAAEAGDAIAEPDELGIGDASYLRSTGGALFGGETVADDLARRGADDDLVSDEDEVAEALDDDVAPEATRAEAAMRGGWIVLQSILAVAFGAGLFIAFDQLWKWNSIVALVLGVLVILGLVVGVRIVRKTEDIGSTLTAVAVGALVTFGPLALLQAN